jgi:hypothetical protein
MTAANNLHRALLRCLGATALLLSATVDAGTALAQYGEAVAKIYVTGPITATSLTNAERRKMSADDVAAHAKAAARGQAITDLQHHLQAMTGAAFDVVLTADPKAVAAPAIVFGELAVALGATAKQETPLRDAFRLIVRDDGLVLFGGESEVAASHAMYHWLRSLGCDWIMPGPEGEVIPVRRRLETEAMDVAQAPSFGVRRPWYSGGRAIVFAEEVQQFAQWKRRMAQTHRHNVSHPHYLIGGHMWHGLLRQFKAELDADPTMRPLVRKPDGTYKRGKYQLEATHPGVVELTVRFIRDYFSRNKWPKDKAVALSIGPNDGGGYSEAPEALAAGGGRVDPITGDNDQTDVLILYANNVLEAVADEFPNLSLGFYIYSVHADYPMKHRPHPKFVAHFADITYSRYHAIEDRQSYTRNYYRGILEQWARLHQEQGNPMWFYGYNWNLAENLFPYTKVRIWGEDLPYYHRMGVSGHNNEQDKAWSILGPHNYIMARMSWDVSLDWRELLREYCRKAFGGAAERMTDYYLLLDDTQTRAGVESGAYPSVPLVLDRAFVRDAKKLLKKAKSAAKTQVHKRNVDWFGQSVFMLEHFHNLRDAAADGKFATAMEHYDTMMAHWQTYLDANPNLVSRYGHRYVDKWCLKPYLKMAHTYSTDDYRLVHQLPEALPTQFDPENMGQLMGMYEPGMLEKDLKHTRTYGSTWDAQGLGPYRDGGVWYYDRFSLKKRDAGEGVGLVIGGVEDTVHVWINGEYIGMGRGYFKPFAFDLTAHAKVGPENVIALQVIRRGNLNEAGLGGLLYPSFVFTGPQLEKVAPAVAPMQRVLPGGARDAAAE